jgi:hypothetical protein
MGPARTKVVSDSVATRARRREKCMVGEDLVWRRNGRGRPAFALRETSSLGNVRATRDAFIESSGIPYNAQIGEAEIF